MPTGDQASRAFQAEVRRQAAAALRSGQLPRRDFPGPFEMSLPALLAEHAALLGETGRIEIDLVEPANKPALWKRLVRPVRLALHRLALFYVNKLAVRQHRVDVHTQDVLMALARRDSEDAERLRRLQIEVEKLRAEIEAARSAPTGEP